jgi:uncharacterized membrane protein (DUF2068 family)
MATSPAPKVLRAPQALDQHANAAGLRAVAILESTKGVLVVALAIAIIALHGHLEDYTEDLLYHLHIDFDHRFAHVLLDAASKLTGTRMLTVGLISSVYATLRFVEAWGLWRRRVWAEWFALVSGGIYLPWEILNVVQRVTWLHVSLLAINVAIIIYMLEMRIRALRLRVKQRHADQTREGMEHK